MSSPTPDILVYGRDWCEDTQATRHQLDKLHIPYRYINTETDPQAAEWVKQQSQGKLRTPALNLGGRILVEPTTEQLHEALRDSGLLT